MDVTVAILTRNRLKLLQACIASLRVQLSGNDTVLVLDTGSTDGTREWLAAGRDSVHVQLVDPDTDFAAARNAAVDSVGSEAIAFIDDDCTAAPDWLARVKSALESCDAVGGPVLPGRAYHFPWWWSAQLSWTIGMSGPGIMRGEPDNYPAAANLAVRVDELRRHPFQRSAHSFGAKQIYLAGREDAQWWLDARIRGARLQIDPQLIVFHHIPDSRIRLPYIWARAAADGTSSWVRRPVPELVPGAAVEAWRGIVRPLLRPFVAVSNPAGVVADMVWSHRQRALISAAKAAGVSAPPRALLTAVRMEAADQYWSIRTSIRAPFRVPEKPHQVLVACPSYLGDNVLVQPLVYQLADTLSDTRITFLTSYPALVQQSRPNLIVEKAERGGEYGSLAGDVNIVPYYHFGSASDWRRVFSRRGVTFSSDAGFERRSDYLRAGKSVEKDFAINELLNLRALFSCWPLKGGLESPALTAPAVDLEELRKAYPELFEEPYVTVQLTAGHPMKLWPLDRWAHVARGLADRFGVRIVLIGDDAGRPQAEELIRSGAVPGAINLCGGPVGPLMALLSGAQLAVGLCSGPKHLAFALGTPTFTLYGPTSPDRWGPVTGCDLHAHICAPSSGLSALEHAGLPANYLMLQLDADAVLSAASARLERLLRAASAGSLRR